VLFCAYILVASVPGAVLLVDEDRVANVLENNILEMDTRGGRGASCGRPCLDPHTIVSIPEGAVHDLDASDVFLVPV